MLKQCGIKKKQECIPVGCVPPARYCMGGSPWQRPPGHRSPRQRPSWTETPWTETPWTENPLDRDPPVMWPVMHAGTETPPVNRMTHRCKNITLPQTSFPGGKYVTFLYRTQEMYDGVLMWILLKGQIATPPTKSLACG